MNVFEQHPKAAYLLALSKMFERAGYYGSRAILVLFLLQFEPNDTANVFEFYGSFTLGVYICYGIGGIVGDFVLGNKKSIIIGAAAQIAGLLALSMENEAFILPATAIFAMGCGLYGPNVLALYGKLYLKRKNVIDAGFVLYYIMINLGAFVGVLVVGQETDNFQIGFIIAAIFMTGSLVLVIITNLDETDQKLPQPKVSTTSGVTIISVIVLGVILFWQMFELNGGHIFAYSWELTNLIGEEDGELWYLDTMNINSFVLMGGGILAFFIFTIRKVSQMKRLFYGFIIAAIAYVAYYFIPDPITKDGLWLFVAAAVIIAIAELFIATVAMSAYVILSKPNRIASVFGIVFLAVGISNKMLGETMYELSDTESANWLFVTAMAIMGIMALVLYLFRTNYIAQPNEDITEEADKSELDELDQLD